MAGSFRLWLRLAPSHPPQTPSLPVSAPPRPRSAPSKSGPRTSAVSLWPETQPFPVTIRKPSSPTFGQSRATPRKRKPCAWAPFGCSSNTCEGGRCVCVCWGREGGGGGRGAPPRARCVTISISLWPSIYRRFVAPRQLKCSKTEKNKKSVGHFELFPTVPSHIISISLWPVAIDPRMATGHWMATGGQLNWQPLKRSKEDRATAPCACELTRRSFFVPPLSRPAPSQTRPR